MTDKSKSLYCHSVSPISLDLRKLKSLEILMYVLRMLEERRG